MSASTTAPLAAAGVVGALAIGLVGVAVLGAPAAGAACSAPASLPTASTVVVDVAGLASDEAVRAEQLRNAGQIMRAAADLGLPRRAQEIGVMTALGESSLRVLDHGDDVGPDSRGLFQQRDNGAWGTYADRMDPYTSSVNFFRALAKVKGWEGLAPTLAAHKVQRNADPYHYERFWTPAQAIVAALAGTVSACQAGSTGPVSADGWTRPIDTSARLTSHFGVRFHPIDHVWRLHAGTDLAAPCGTPIYAAAAGTVVAAGGSGASTQRDLVLIDHGGGISSGYMHMFADGIHVSVGQAVAAGDRIAAVGSAGQSTGCHLHFEIRTNGTAIDPEPFMAERGVPLS